MIYVKIYYPTGKSFDLCERTKTIDLISYMQWDIGYELIRSNQARTCYEYPYPYLLLNFVDTHCLPQVKKLQLNESTLATNKKYSFNLCVRRLTISSEP